MIAASNSTGKEKLKLSGVVSLTLTEEVIRKLIDSSSFNSDSTINVEQRGRS